MRVCGIVFGARHRPTHSGNNVPVRTGDDDESVPLTWLSERHERRGPLCVQFGRVDKKALAPP